MNMWLALIIAFNYICNIEPLHSYIYMHASIFSYDLHRRKFLHKEMTSWQFAIPMSCAL